MTQATLHYIADPLCGWCYAAAPLVRAARDVVGLDVVFHGGGMMAGPNAQPVTPQLRDYVMPHDRRIAALTGQPFGDAYFDGLLRDGTAVFDSAPPTAAALAIGGHIERLEVGHYLGQPDVWRDALRERLLSAQAASSPDGDASTLPQCGPDGCAL